MDDINKKPLILLIVMIIAFIMIIAFKQMLSFTDKYNIKTDCGDTFCITYDSFKGESTVTSPNSIFDWNYGGRINKDDFILLDKTDSVTIYEVNGSVIFNDGNGFEEFDGENIDEKPEVANRVKEVLLSDYSVYSSNFELFLNSRTYKQEANQIIDYIKHEKLDKLSQYGLTEDVINDRYTLNLIKKSINNL